MPIEIATMTMSAPRSGSLSRSAATAAIAKAIGKKPLTKLSMWFCLRTA